jgi:hypothetical protein
LPHVPPWTVTGSNPRSRDQDRPYVRNREDGESYCRADQRQPEPQPVEAIHLTYSDTSTLQIVALAVARHLRAVGAFRD